MTNELFGNPISGYTTEYYSKLIEDMSKDVKNNYSTLNGNKRNLDSKAKSSKVRF